MPHIQVKLHKINLSQKKESRKSVINIIICASVRPHCNVSPICSTVVFLPLFRHVKAPFAAQALWSVTLFVLLSLCSRCKVFLQCWMVTNRGRHRLSGVSLLLFIYTLVFMWILILWISLSTYIVRSLSFRFEEFSLLFSVLLTSCSLCLNVIIALTSNSILECEMDSHLKRLFILKAMIPVSTATAVKKIPEQLFFFSKWTARTWQWFYYDYEKQRQPIKRTSLPSLRPVCFMSILGA